MIKKLMCRLKKKEEGASTYLATMLSIFVIFLLFLALFLNYSQVAAQNKVERSYRKYLLLMEKEGYLTSEAQSDLLTELTALGMSNISLSGTSTTAVGYGGEVVLHIEGDLEVERLKFTAGSSARAQEDVHVVIEKTGTALH